MTYLLNRHSPKPNPSTSNLSGKTCVRRPPTKQKNKKKQRERETKASRESIGNRNDTRAASRQLHLVFLIKPENHLRSANVSPRKDPPNFIPRSRERAVSPPPETFFIWPRDKFREERERGVGRKLKRGRESDLMRCEVYGVKRKIQVWKKESR